MFRSIGLIVSGNLGAAVLTMARTLLVSRLITLQDFGVATTLVLAVTLVDMMSALGFPQQMVQSKSGHAPHFQAALQGLSAMRGVLNGAILLALAFPLAGFFGIPEVAWAFALIAIVPVVAGFSHLDPARFHRQMNYLPTTLIAIVPPLGSLAAVYPAYWLFGDYRTLLCAVMVQMGLACAMTHAVAQRPYRLAFDRAVIAGALRYGWPLMVGGLLMYAVFNGERVIIARTLDLATLALFSMALSLSLTPALVIANSCMSFFLPQLSGAVGQPAHARLATVSVQCHLVLGNLLLVTIAVAGGPFLQAVLGDKYAAAIPLLTWLAVVQAIRVFKGGCSAIALSGGVTRNQAVLDVVRVALLPLAWILLARGGDLLTLILIGMAGEVAGLALGLILLRWQGLLQLRPLLRQMAVSAALVAVACWQARVQQSWAPGSGAAVALIALLGLSVWAAPDLRAYIRARTATGHAG